MRTAAWPLSIQSLTCLKIILEAGCGTINTNVKKEKAPLFKFSYFSFATPWGRVAAAQGWKLAIFGQIKRNDPVLRPKWNQKKIKWDPHWTLKSSFIFQANECRKDQTFHRALCRLLRWIKAMTVKVVAASLLPFNAPFQSRQKMLSQMIQIQIQ